MAKPTPSSTSLPVTAASPSPSRLWPTPDTMDGPHGARGISSNPKHQSANSLEAVVRSAPSPSRRLTPMPAPSSLTDGPVSPISGMSETSQRIRSFAAAVFSRWSLLGASPASRTATPASDGPASTNATSGMNVPECLGSYDPASRSSRTSPGYLAVSQDFFSTAYCQTWPKSGMAVNGKLYPLPTLAPPTDGSASGSSAGTNEAWLTPRANEPEDDPGFVERNGDRGAHCSGSLGQQVKREVSARPTPIASDALGHSQSKVNRIADGEENVVTQLREVVQMERSGPPRTASGLPDLERSSTSGSRPESWATPQSRDFRTSEGNEDRWENPERSRNLNDQTKAVQGSGKLNPSWVETLMGLPLGHTQLPVKFAKPKAAKK